MGRVWQNDGNVTFPIMIEERLKQATALLQDIREALDSIVEDAKFIKEYARNVTE